MTVSRTPKRARRQPFSYHPSNPFDDPDVARRALGYGSSELSGCSSDLGGYGDPGPTQYFEKTSGEEFEPAPDNVRHGDAAIELEVVGDDEENLETIEGYHDDDMEEEAFWDEEEFEEEHSIYFKTAEERHEIEAEIQDLQRVVPRLKEDYEILDRLGTGMLFRYFYKYALTRFTLGTFSSVYKAIDLRHHEWSNSSWRGQHPPDSSAYYQSAEHNPSRKFFVAIKRIYVTSMPERIRNEISILEDVRGCRHVSQLITAFREADQVVAIMPYHRNEDFRVNMPFFIIQCPC